VISVTDGVKRACGAHSQGDGLGVFIHTSRAPTITRTVAAAAGRAMRPADCAGAGAMGTGLGGGGDIETGSGAIAGAGNGAFHVMPHAS